MREQPILPIAQGRSTARRWVAALGLLLVATPKNSVADEMPAVVRLRPPTGGIQPRAIVDRKGALHLLYYTGAPDAGDLFYARQKRGHSGFSPAIRVNRQPGSAVAAGTIRGGQMAIGTGGRVHVVWFGSGKARPRAPANGTPMLYTRLNDSGTAFEPERNLMQSTRLLDGGGSVAVGKAREVYVTWHAADATSEKEADRRLWIARSKNEGKQFTREAPVSPPGTGACACCSTHAFVDSRGTLYQLYRAARDSIDRDMMLVTSGSQGKRFDCRSLQPWKVAACPMSSMSFAEGKRGVFAAWETEGQVYYARIDPKSLQVTRPIAAPGSGKERKHPVVAVSPRGETLLVWTEGTGWQKGGDLAWQLFDRNDQPRGATGRVRGGIPVWGHPAAVWQPIGRFTILH